jgi:hypothetical protein
LTVRKNGISKDIPRFLLPLIFFLLRRRRDSISFFFHFDIQKPTRVGTKMVSEEPKESPKDPKTAVEHGKNVDGIFSPRFKSVAAMAGWDEEAILLASLVVEDTPDRESKCKKRSDLHFKTPPTNSRR